VADLFLLDTNILVHFVRSDRVWERVRKAYSPLLSEPRPIVSVISDGELRSLAYQFNWQSDKRSQMHFCLGYFQRTSIDHPAILEAYAIIDSRERPEHIHETMRQFAGIDKHTLSAKFPLGRCPWLSGPTLPRLSSIGVGLVNWVWSQLNEKDKLTGFWG
jgi:hypothetical protein